MSAIVTVVAEGDLVVAIGRIPVRKFAKISSTILKIVSPVFAKMLGPSFREGQTKHDTSNPLELPEDDPTAVLNLLHIVHYAPMKVDKTHEDWMQRLFVTCEKYQCISPVTTYFLAEIRENNSGLSIADKFVMSGLMGDRNMFHATTADVVRATEQDIRYSIHQGLLELPSLPEDMLKRMSEYRMKARIDYRSKAMDSVAKMYFINGLNSFELCDGLRNRLALFNTTLFQRGILKEEVLVDAYLPDVTEIVSSSPLANNDGTPGLDDLTCATAHSDCQSCVISVENIIFHMMKTQQFGTDAHCQVCFQCFRERVFTFLHECNAHNMQW